MRLLTSILVEKERIQLFVLQKDILALLQKLLLIEMEVPVLLLDLSSFLLNYWHLFD